MTFIFIGIVSRLAPHLPNMTPVGAISLFASAKYGVKKALITTLVTMLVTDLLIGLHPVMWATYGSLLVAVIIGRWVGKSNNATRLAYATFASSLVFFVVTNFAVWLAPISMYPKTISGLFECYVMALPFFRNSLIGDIFYTFIFFGGYEFVKATQRRLAYRL